MTSSPTPTLAWKPQKRIEGGCQVLDLPVDEATVLTSDDLEFLEERVTSHVMSGPVVSALIATARHWKGRVDAALEQARDDVRIANANADRDFLARSKAEDERDLMRRERDDALAQLPRLRDEIKSLHRELSK